MLNYNFFLLGLAILFSIDAGASMSWNESALTGYDYNNRVNLAAEHNGKKFELLDFPTQMVFYGQPNGGRHGDFNSYFVRRSHDPGDQFFLTVIEGIEGQSPGRHPISIDIVSYSYMQYKKTVGGRDYFHPKDHSGAFKPGEIQGMQLYVWFADPENFESYDVVFGIQVEGGPEERVTVSFFVEPPLTLGAYDLDFGQHSAGQVQGLEAATTVEVNGAHNEVIKLTTNEEIVSLTTAGGETLQCQIYLDGSKETHINLDGSGYGEAELRGMILDAPTAPGEYNGVVTITAQYE